MIYMNQSSLIIAIHFKKPTRRTKMKTKQAKKKYWVAMFEGKTAEGKKRFGAYTTISNTAEFPLQKALEEIGENLKELEILTYSEISKAAYNQKLILLKG